MNERTRHVGIFVSSLHTGGAEKVAITIANEFARSGLLVDLIVMKSGGELKSQISSKVCLIELETNRGRSSFFSLLSYIRSSRPEAVLSFLTVPNALLGLTKIVLRSKSPRLVGSERSYMTDINVRGGRNLFNYTLYVVITRVGYRLLDANVALTTGIYDRMKTQRLVKPSKIVVLPNPIDLARIVLRQNSKVDSHGRIELLAVGRLDELKDYPTMIRAVQRLRETHDAHLTILGDGAKRSELQLLINEMKLSNYVTLFGNVSDTSSWYSKAHLLVLSSKVEGFPNVIVEAMAHGVPVVSTDCMTGPKDILRGTEFGELVPVGDFRALANAVLILIDRELDSKFLRSRAEDFDSKKVCKLYERLLLDIT
jgi:glycosyltransferase involved in cell wall biosynthesis